MAFDVKIDPADSFHCEAPTTRYTLIFDPEDKTIGTMSYISPNSLSPLTYHHRAIEFPLPESTGQYILEAIAECEGFFDQLAQLYKGSEWNGSIRIGQWEDSPERHGLEDAITTRLSECPPKA